VTNSQEPYPFIDVENLQKVAIDRCGVPPEEVTLEHLTGQKTSSAGDCSSICELVING
jgi:hypothetical protein